MHEPMAAPGKRMGLAGRKESGQVKPARSQILHIRSPGIPAVADHNNTNHFLLLASQTRQASQGSKHCIALLQGTGGKNPR